MNYSSFVILKKLLAFQTMIFFIPKHQVQLKQRQKKYQSNYILPFQKQSIIKFLKVENNKYMYIYIYTPNPVKDESIPLEDKSKQ